MSVVPHWRASGSGLAPSIAVSLMLLHGGRIVPLFDTLRAAVVSWAERPLGLGADTATEWHDLSAGPVVDAVGSATGLPSLLGSVYVPDGGWRPQVEAWSLVGATLTFVCGAPGTRSGSQ